MKLETYDNQSLDRGRLLRVEVIWVLIQGLLFSTWVPGSGWRCFLLRAFGAKIGKKVVIKPGVRVKFPWRLEIGDCSWIGERVWIDNLASVNIGSHACISQGAYLCTGSHNWSLTSFDLITKPIRIGNHAWIGAQTCIAPGVTMGEGAVLCMGSIAAKDLEPWTIYQENPAVPVRERKKTSEG